MDTLKQSAYYFLKLHYFGVTPTWTLVMCNLVPHFLLKNSLNTVQWIPVTLKNTKHAGILHKLLLWVEIVQSV